MNDSHVPVNLTKKHNYKETMFNFFIPWLLTSWRILSFFEESQIECNFSEQCIFSSPCKIAETLSLIAYC